MTENKLLVSLADLKKKFGKHHFDLGAEDCERISSKVISIDKVFGGGLPLRKITEIYGGESSGKTGISLQFAKNVIDSGKSVCYIDSEHGLNLEYLKSFGLQIDGEKFIFARPDYGEEAGEIASTMLEHKEIGLIVVDSVPSLMPRSEFEGDIGDSHMGHAARLLSQILRMTIPKLTQSNAAIIFINQIRETMGNPFGPSETTPGGRGLKFYSAIRCKTTKIKTITDGELPVGIRIKIHNIKNKTARPYLKSEFDLHFNTGISLEGDLIDNATTYNLLKMSGPWVYYNNGKEEIKLAQGRANTIQLLKDNPDLFLELYQKTVSASLVEA